MMKIRKIFIITAGILLLNCLLLKAQATKGSGDTTGIKFEQGLDLDQALEKAYAENKYLFIDCYATWCGPCKWMEQNIYSLKEVGDVYNRRFISIKMQMDKTPGDSPAIRQLYHDAEKIASRNHVDAYPAFLFYDPKDFRPLHKVTGAMDAKAFIQMAADAQNPDKQYYTLIKNFEPGKLDTGEEKSLARLFGAGDKLGVKMAVDYLHRVPEGKFSADDGKLLVDFEDDPTVFDIALNYINTHNKADNLYFIEALSRKPVVKTIALSYISNLNDEAIGEKRNLHFLEFFRRDSTVKKIAQTYIDKLPDDSLYTPKMLEFLSVFTQTPVDRGFDVFYTNGKKVDELMKNKGYARGMAINIVNKKEFDPVLDSAKQTGKEPDWQKLSAKISQKYNKDFAKDIVINGKVAWYKYFVIDKKNDKYWPQLLDAKLVQVHYLKWDTLTTGYNVNNIANDYFFLYSNNHEQLITAAKWLERFVAKYPDSPLFADTYACLLYKAGEKQKALEIEKKALQAATVNNDKDDIALCKLTIPEMEAGKPIWLDKERQ